MRAAQCLQQGRLLAHSTSTVAGIAANPTHPQAIQRLRRFKQRQGPFVLLAASKKVVFQQCRYITRPLRTMLRHYLNTSVTLILPAKGKRSSACQKKGHIAIRLDNKLETRRLAKQCGGLLLSSSLNRRGQATLALQRSTRMRLSRHIASILTQYEAHTPQQASKIYTLSKRGIQRLR
ncbi:MAG: Sua5/YciO/YrdC/YwlC family protein [Mariprofundaceae bacterium]|nr:Sua5/YciO/YrdC/YwlC family protein [Mariprofundaceae bacterium]